MRTRNFLISLGLVFTTVLAQPVEAQPRRHVIEFNRPAQAAPFTPPGLAQAVVVRHRGTVSRQRLARIYADTAVRQAREARLFGYRSSHPR